MPDGITAQKQVGDGGQPFISKSKFLSGIQCWKLLWTAYNAKDLIPPPDAAQHAIFDQGHEVGALAKQLYPGGIEISGDANDFDAVLRLSLEAAKQREPLFEAGFVYNGEFGRADILNPVGDGQWDIVEVKSSTEVKDVKLLDLAFQAFVYNGAGLSTRRCHLMQVDSSYVRRGEIDPNKFFKLAEAFPVHAGWIEKVKRRVVDLLEPFQSFDYYHPDQHGSASIKAVLPVLTGRSYGDLEIQEGGQASLEYLRVHFADVPEAERQQVRRQLEDYCGQDTEGMVWIVDALRQFAA
jgi:hypothetical protein